LSAVTLKDSVSAGWTTTEYRDRNYFYTTQVTVDQMAADATVQQHCIFREEIKENCTYLEFVTGPRATKARDTKTLNSMIPTPLSPPRLRSGVTKAPNFFSAGFFGFSHLLFIRYVFPYMLITFALAARDRYLNTVYVVYKSIACFFFYSLSKKNYNF
jgi:hypothetical protein